ncbi:DMT family transporter [Bacillus sp. T33-2]|uniref:DMT family transporter n=1 Tax=Bacillus sp. T33-2 TaxID=2054168 RepID=UPI000C77F645|nr:DMT family transporter [Bacillus sp. T33-2]PLR99684.1 EamA family transporter [Bacillus sp. T33-2]
MRKSMVADVSLLLVALIWGATFVLVQNAIAFLEPFSFNAVRFTAAALLLAVWLLLFQRNQLAALNWRSILAGATLGFWLFIGYASQTIGLLYTTSSKAGFITGLSVVMVPLFAMAFFKYRPGWNTIAGVAAAAIGLYFLTMTDITALNKGDGFVFVCAIAFAVQILLTGKYSSKFPTLLLTVIQIATVAGLSGLSAMVFEDWKKAFQPEVIFSVKVMSALVVTAVFATALAFLAQTAFQKYTTATRVALIFAMEPVFAAITGYIWADELLSASALFGCLLIFAGMVFAELPPGLKIFKKMLPMLDKKTG